MVLLSALLITKTGNFFYQALAKFMFCMGKSVYDPDFPTIFLIKNHNFFCFDRFYFYVLSLAFSLPPVCNGLTHDRIHCRGIIDQEQPCWREDLNVNKSEGPIGSIFVFHCRDRSLMPLITQ